MNEGRILFAQITDFLPRKVFETSVRKYRGDYKVKEFSCHDQLLTLLFAQYTDRSSLRSIEVTLRANRNNLYRMGFKCKTIARNTLANANEQRPWIIFAELAQHLMRKAHELYANESLSVELDARVFALDSTTIDLCLARFPWTPSQQSKAAVKMSVLLDLRGNIPQFIVITRGKTRDVHFLDDLTFLAGAYYIMDRGYVDFTRMYRIHESQAFFVTRAKRRMKFRVVTSRVVDKEAGLRCDQTIRMTGDTTRKAYPDVLRRIKYRDPKTGRYLVFLTNDFSIPASMVAELYKQRWQIELFFKWIKQHLRVKNFYGYSENAVRTQLWVAVAAYCLLAIIKKELGGDRELYEIQEILSASAFQKMPILQAFSDLNSTDDEKPSYNPPSLFDL